MTKFVQEHLKYPETALETKTEGTVKVEYSLNQTGKVMKATAVEGPGNGCREEAERVVKLLRFMVPKDYKTKVRYHQHLNINFKLPKPKAAPKKAAPVTHLNYEIRPSQPAKPASQAPSASPQPESGGYNYTIKW